MRDCTTRSSAHCRTRTRLSGRPRVSGSLLVRHPAFRRVFLADALSQLAHGMLMVAFPMFILQVTGDVSLTGLAFSGEVAAFGLLSPLAGWLADQVAQKRLMILANLSRIALLLLLLQVLQGGGTLAQCLGLSLALGASAALFVPARAAFLRDPNHPERGLEGGV